jgi:hypothetical protein
LGKVQMGVAEQLLIAPRKEAVGAVARMEIVAPEVGPHLRLPAERAVHMVAAVERVVVKNITLTPVIFF